MQLPVGQCQMEKRNAILNIPVVGWTLNVIGQVFKLFLQIG